MWYSCSSHSYPLPRLCRPDPFAYPSLYPTWYTNASIMFLLVKPAFGYHTGMLNVGLEIQYVQDSAFQGH